MSRTKITPTDVVDIAALVPVLLPRLGDPDDPNLRFMEKAVRAKLREMGVRLRPSDYTGLMLALRRTPIVPDAALVARVRAQLGDREPFSRNIRKVVDEIGLTLTYRQIIGLHRYIATPARTELTDAVLAHLRTHSVGRRLTRASVAELAAQLGYRLSMSDIHRAARRLRLSANEEKVMLDSATVDLARIMADKAGVPVKAVLHRALLDSALGMLDHARFQFDARGRDPLSVRNIRLHMQVIDPASYPREADVEP